MTGAMPSMCERPVPSETASLRECNRCHRNLSVTDYHRDRTLRDGRRYTCKSCAKQATRRSWRRKNDDTQGLWSVYHAMKKRCYDPRHHSYPRYGGRGIRVCDLWLASFDAFQAWAATHGHSRGLQLDRGPQPA